MLLIASRATPSEPRLINIFVEFIEKAKQSENDEAIAFAEDLLGKSDLMVYFQNPKNVSEFRKRINELRNMFATPNAPITPKSPFSSIRALLTISQNPSIPLNVRSKAAEQARSALENAQLDQAINQIDNQEDNKTNEVKSLMIQVDNAEKQCITGLFLERKPKFEQWVSTTVELSKEIDKTPAEKVPDVSRRISESVSQGFDFLQEIMPFSKSKVEGASFLSSTLEKQIRLLQRQKNWIYNQQVLRLIRDIESKKEWTPEDKIRHLADVSEEILSPYILRRHNELWEKVFENLPSEEKKVWAVRLRILKNND